MRPIQWAYEPPTFSHVDGALAKHTFLYGEQFSIADITAFCGMAIAELWRLPPPAELTHLARWHAEVGARPSAATVAYR